MFEFVITFSLPIHLRPRKEDAQEGFGSAGDLLWECVRGIDLPGGEYDARGEDDFGGGGLPWTIDPSLLFPLH